MLHVCIKHPSSHKMAKTGHSLWAGEEWGGHNFRISIRITRVLDLENKQYEMYFREFKRAAPTPTTFMHVHVLMLELECQ